MHKFPTASSLRRLRIASLLLIFNRYIAIPGFFILLIRSFLLHNSEKALIALALLPVIGLMALFEYLLSARTHCPLCMTPVLGARSCTKHRNSKKLFFSYKLRVALGALFGRSIRCPYCNEPSQLIVRQRGSHKG